MHNCPCCGDDVVYTDDPDDVCSDCEQAGCEPEDFDGGCKVREMACPDCGTPPSFLTDGKWHPNCEPDECERARKEGNTPWNP